VDWSRFKRRKRTNAVGDGVIYEVKADVNRVSGEEGLVKIIEGRMDKLVEVDEVGLVEVWNDERCDGSLGRRGG
jgi:hypothetical protein